MTEETKTLRDFRKELGRRGHTKSTGTLLIFPGRAVTAELVKTRSRWAVDTENKQTGETKREYFQKRQQAISYAFAISEILPFTHNGATP